MAVKTTPIQQSPTMKSGACYPCLCVIDCLFVCLFFFNPYFFKSQTKETPWFGTAQMCGWSRPWPQLPVPPPCPRPPIDPHRWALCGEEMLRMNSTCIPWPCQYLVLGHNKPQGAQYHHTVKHEDDSLQQPEAKVWNLPHVGCVQQDCIYRCVGVSQDTLLRSLTNRARWEA